MHFEHALHEALVACLGLGLGFIGAIFVIIPPVWIFFEKDRPILALLWIPTSIFTVFFVLSLGMSYVL